MLFHGRCSFIQYTADYSTKIYALCDMKTYCAYSLEIYCRDQKSGHFITLNKPFDVVGRLIDPIMN